MKKSKTLAICAFLFSAFTATANAATANFGYEVVDLDKNTAIGAFADSYTFELTALTSSIDYTVTKIIQNYDDLSVYDFQSGEAGFNYALYNSADQKIFDSSALIAGIYTLKVSGISTGIYGGFYNLYANVTATPVPEADTSLMVLLGLSMIGLASARKMYSV